MNQSTEERSKLNYSVFINRHNGVIKKLEKYAILIFLIGLLFNYLKVEGTNFILFIGTISLTIIYFLFSLRPYEFERITDHESKKSIISIIFFNKLSFMGAAIAIISFLVLIIEINNPGIIFIIGGFSLLLSGIATLYFKSKYAIEEFDTIYFLRIITILILLTALLIFRYNLI